MPTELRQEPRLAPEAIDTFAEKLPKAPAFLDPVPKTCERYTKRRAPKSNACTTQASAVAALDGALGASGDARDEKLAALETCGFFPEQLVRVLRADLAPLPCAEGLVGGVVAAPPQGMAKVLHHAASGLVLASRLSRLAHEPPVYKGRSRKDDVLAFVRGALLAYLREQATAIEEASVAASRLRFYGRGVAALEAGLSDLRLVEVMRKAPVPTFIANDAELKEVYETALEQALEPRKARGRDAVLVGLRDLAATGALDDARVRTARATLAGMYAGRRIDALDALILPDAAAPTAAPAAGSPASLATKLPTFYAGLVLTPGDAGGRTDVVALGDEALGALAQRGLPPAFRVYLTDASAPALRGIHARARLRSAVTYLRAVDVDEALRALAPLGAEARGNAGTFALALGLALHDGPEDAGALMRTPPSGKLFPARTDALDALTERRGDDAGAAAFDAAYVRRVAAPLAPDASYWRDVEKRFRRAEELLTTPEQKARAQAFAREAAEVAAQKPATASAPR